LPTGDLDDIGRGEHALGSLARFDTGYIAEADGGTQRMSEPARGEMADDAAVA
jgi:hypothetical protein